MSLSQLTGSLYFSICLEYSHPHIQLGNQPGWRPEPKKGGATVLQSQVTDIHMGTTQRKGYIKDNGSQISHCVRRGLQIQKGKKAKKVWVIGLEPEVLRWIQGFKVFNSYRQIHTHIHAYIHTYSLAGPVEKDLEQHYNNQETTYTQIKHLFPLKGTWAPWILMLGQRKYKQLLMPENMKTLKEWWRHFKKTKQSV